jgi:hypothetical protein
MSHGELPQEERPWLLAMLFLACVAIAIAPLALRGTSCGQDFDFHYDSWISVVHHWHQGVLYPNWLGSANYGAGEPRFVFYPPLSWALGAFLGLVLPWTWTPVAFILICLITSGAACYHMARHWMPPATATLAAGLYLTNPYLLFVVYERSALGEFMAAAWFPLLILYALRPHPHPASPGDTRKAKLLNLLRDPNLPLLALSISLLWLTDAPAGVMGSYALAVIVTVAAITRRCFAPVARAALAVPLGLALTAFYLIPAIYQQRWVEIARAIASGMRVQDSFLFEHTGMAYHDQVLRSVSFIAVILLAAIAISIAILIIRTSSEDGAPGKPAVGLSGLGRPFLILAALITLLLFPISQPIWNNLPKLRYLQFPWRWLLVLGLIAAVFVAKALAALSSRIGKPNAIPLKAGEDLMKSARLHRSRLILPAAAVILFAAITATHADHYYWQRCDDQDNTRAQLADTVNPGFEGTDEYTPTPADNSAIQMGLPPVRVVASATADQAADEPSGDNSDQSSDSDDNAGNPTWQPAPHVLLPAAITIRMWHDEHIIVSIRSPQAAYAVFRLMSYPAWRVRINQGPAASSRSRRSDGLLAVPIPAGTTTIDVRFAATPDVWAGRIVSLLALALWLALAAKSARQRGIMERHAS